MKLFPTQREAIENGYLDSNNHYLLNMATGSGKTYLSELAIEQVMKSGYKAIYITPLRSLAAQQCKSWKKKYAGYNVGVFTGETLQSSKTQSAYSRSHLLVMTPERFDVIMRNWRSHWSWIPDVSLIVVDEFHILGQAQRGPRLEGALTRIVRLNPFARIIGLSATMPNVDELASWLRGKSYSSSWRQIMIQKDVVRFNAAKDKPQLVLEKVRECIASGGKSIVFCNSRSRVQQLTDFFSQNGVNAAAHHAGLLQEVRTKHENGFKSSEYSVLVATSTVEMGLNFPARQVIVYDSYSYMGTGFENLPVWRYIQRMGRAGRPGLDSSGECTLMLPKWSGDTDKYLREDCEPVLSQLTDNRSMTEQILIDVHAGYTRTRNELIHGFLPLTLYKAQHPDANINGLINKLVLSDLLVEASSENKDGNPKDSILKAGLLGRMAVRLMLAPETVTLIHHAKKSFKQLYMFDLMLLSALTIDCSPVLQTNYEEMDSLCNLVQHLPSVLMDLTVERLQKKLPEVPNTQRILSAIKMAAICYCITEGEEFSEIADTFDVYESDIYILQESVVRLLMGISAVSSAIDKSELGEEEASKAKKDIYSVTSVSTMLSNMLQYGIDCKSVVLTKLKGVGGKTARKLAESGFESIARLQSATSEQLSAIGGVGKKQAESILKQVSEIKFSDFPVYSEENEAEIESIREIKTSIDPYRLRRSMELSVKGKDGGRFHITGGREDHIVMIRSGQYTCDCMDYLKNTGPCKHILCAKRAMGDPEITKMAKRIKENKSHSIREALPSLWFSMTGPER